MKRTVKSREELEELFKSKGYTRDDDEDNYEKGMHQFTWGMFDYCGKEFYLREKDSTGRFHMEEGAYAYFLEEWLVPLENEKYSREWWKERLPLITAYVDGETIQSNDGVIWRDITPVFDWNIENYRIKPKTITVNGIEVEAPLKETPGDVWVWLIQLATPSLARHIHADTVSFENYERGLVHATNEGAIAHARAMLVMK